MRLLCLLPLVLALSVGVAGDVPAPAFVVVVNKSNQLNELSKAKLALLYRRKVSRWPWGAEVQPVDLDDASPLRRNFIKMALRTTPDQLKIYWIDQKASQNMNPPPSLKTAHEVKVYVTTHPGAVAYLPPELVDDTLKVLKVQ